MDKLEVSEIFNSIQGEGPSAGRLATFVRFCRCPLACTWCDSRYAWDRDDPGYETSIEYTVKELQQKLLPLVSLTHRLVLTGGEPLLWKSNFLHLLNPFIYDWNASIEIETAGTIEPLPFLDTWDYRYNVSPKLSSSGNVDKHRLNLEILRQFNKLRSPHVCFKFVCENEADLLEVRAIAQEAYIPPDRIWIMPEGTDVETILKRSRELIEPVMRAGYNFSQRQHVLLWGDERGR